MAGLAAWLKNDGDLLLLQWTGRTLVASAAIMAGIALFTTLRVPYGRYSKDDSVVSRLGLIGCMFPPRLAWFLQELPSFLIPMLLVLNVGGRHVGLANPNIVLLGMFIMHYIYRAFVYPLMLGGKGYPLLTLLVGIFFTSVNGYYQGRYLTHYIEYDISWFYDPRFLLGHVTFLVGMAINLHSDCVLRTLRKPGETGYKIPKGGLFDYVSGANYFGESLEWCGYAVACWSWPATVYAIWTALFLGTRAIQHHRFYLQKFEDYPKNRTAFIPFVV